jgi:hypothetical protein
MNIDSPGAHCLPTGLGASGSLRPYRLAQTRDVLVIIEEANDPTRQIYLDGRHHPDDPNPSYMGHSVVIGKATPWWSIRSASPTGAGSLLAAIRKQKNYT